MDKKTLENFVRKGYTLKQMSNETGYSQTNIRYWLVKYELKTKASLPQKHACKICGEDDVSKFYIHNDGRFRYRCRKCDNDKIIERYKNNKQRAVDYKGGCCIKCGYSKCLRSLDFHHLDPKEKDHTWIKMRNWPLERIKKELDKCMLVCRNCHGEIHDEIDHPKSN